MASFDPSKFGDDTTVPGEVIEEVLPDGTRARNLDQPTPFDVEPELAPIADPVADQMAEELVRLGFKDADDPDATPPLLEAPVVNPATGEVPASESASPPVSEEAPVVDTTDPSTPVGYELDFGGQVGKLNFTDTELRDALIRDAAFARKPPETWAILSDIETGRSVPLPRAEYDEYQRLKSAPQVVQQGPAKLSDDDLYGVDPATIARIRALEAQAVGTPAPVSAPVPHTPAPTQPSHAEVQLEQQRLAQINDVANASLTSFKAANTLSDEDVQELEAYAAQMGLVQRYAGQHETRAYDGSVLNTDFSGLFDHVLTDAYAAHPKFRQRQIDAEVQRRLDADQTAIRKTNTKRNLAASISSAPSAATTTPNAAPRTRSETTEAIAGWLRQEGVS